jgi:AbrB family looped-hinge helix DNA binding protein
MKATVTSKGQITIPVRLRERFGLEPGTVLEFDEDAPVLTARRIVPRGQMDRAAGALASELSARSAREWLEDLRGPADLPEE